MRAIDRRRAYGGKVLPADIIMTTATNPEVLAICYAQGWCANENYMTATEAAAVTDIGTAFKSNNIIKHFDEFQYFTGVTSLVGQAFSDSNKLTSIMFPPTLSSISGRCFYDCDGFTEFTIPSTITSVATSVFYMTRNLVKIKINARLSSLQIFNMQANYAREYESDVYDVLDGMLYDDTKLLACPLNYNRTSYTTPSFVTELLAGSFHETSLTSLTINEGCTVIRGGDNGGIQGMRNLIRLDLPSTLTTLENRSVYQLNKLNTLICRAMTAPTTTGYAVQNLGSQATGTKTLYIHRNAVGYDAGKWLTLQNNGWRLAYIEDM